MNRTGDEQGQGRRRRFRTQAWVLGGIVVAIYFGYLAFMIAKGSGAA